MINSLYIIHRSGSMMFNESWEEDSRAYSDKALLISGLLTAFTGLTQEALKDQIKEIVLENQRIIFQFYPTHYVVIVADKKVKISIIDTILNRISDEFNIRYDLTDFTGKIDGFRIFSDVVNKIIEDSKPKRDEIKENLKALLKSEIDLFSIKKYRGDNYG